MQRSQGDWENGVDDFRFREYAQQYRAQDMEGSERSFATTSVETHERRVAAQPPSRPLTGAERLSRNRAAKRAVMDVGLYSHLSTMAHMHRRIYEMYSKAGLLQHQKQAPGRSRSATGQRPGTAAAPTVAGIARSLSPGGDRRQLSRPTTAPNAAYTQQPQGLAVRVEQWAQPPAAAAPRPEAAPVAPSYVKRHVQNTAAALKAAILDEIVENRVFESQRLKALFRSYLKLNAGEAFFPTLAAVIEELRGELGVA